MDVSTDGTDWREVDEHTMLAWEYQADITKMLVITKHGVDDREKPNPETEPWVVVGDNTRLFFASRDAAKEWVNDTIHSDGSLAML